MEKSDILKNINLFYKCVLFLSIKKEVELQEICNVTGYQKNARYLRELIKIMEENNFIIINKEYKAHRYKVNRDKLGFFLRESNLFLELGEISRATRPYEYNL